MGLEERLTKLEKKSKTSKNYNIFNDPLFVARYIDCDHELEKRGNKIMCKKGCECNFPLTSELRFENRRVYNIKTGETIVESYEKGQKDAE